MLVAADFAEHYGIRLAGSGMKWPEFSLLVLGLLSCQSRVRSVFAPPSDPAEIPETGEEE